MTVTHLNKNGEVIDIKGHVISFDDCPEIYHYAVRKVTEMMEEKTRKEQNAG